MAFAFAGQWGPEPVVDRYGNAIYSATFRVLTTAGAEATVYTDRTKATTVSQPLDVDGEANATFYAAPGRYTVELTAGGSVTSFPVGVVPDAEDVEPAPDVDTRFAATAWRTGRLVYDVTDAAYGAVGDGSADDTAAIQTAIDAAEAAGGGFVYFPDGTYRCLSQLVVNAPGVWLVGAGREAVTVSFETGTTVDGLAWVNASASPYLYGGGIRDLTFKGATDGSSVRDVAYFEEPGNLTIDNVTFRGAARYGLHLSLAINVTLSEVVSRNNVSAGLYVGAATSTSTTIRARGCYFQYNTNGPGVDIDSLGCHFDGCVFESSGLNDAANGVGARIRKGQAGFDNCYWENNASHDIVVGTADVAFVSVVNMHSLSGAYDAGAGKAHIYVDQFTRGLTVQGGKFDARAESLIIHPSARGVFGHIAASANNDPIMSDASDVGAGVFGLLFGLETATGELRTWGRFDPHFRRVQVTDYVALPNGAATTPAWRFSGDPDNGAFYINTDRWALAVGGANTLDLSTARIYALKNLRMNGTLNWTADSGGVLDTHGTGTPEGVLTASVGSVYRRTDGGAGTTLYIKESGVGNTGWVAK